MYGHAFGMLNEALPSGMGINVRAADTRNPYERHIENMPKGCPYVWDYQNFYCYMGFFC